MTAKDFLLRVQTAELELRLVRDRRQHYNDLIASIGAAMRQVVVQTSGNNSKTETAAIGLVDLEEHMADREKEYVQLVNKAEGMIAQIRQPKFREVLTRKYLIGESWGTIRDKMEYSDKKSVFECHRYAMREFGRVMRGLSADSDPTSTNL